MRWANQEIGVETDAALPGLAKLNNLVRTVKTPEFDDIVFHEVLAKSALNQVPGGSKVMPYAWTINPYRGCSHACAYCFARPTHKYLELNVGHDFDSQIIVKVNVDEVLRRELARPTWQANPHPVALGTNTDPYQRAEGRYKLMPGIIQALADARTPFSILTKGTLLRRDLPLLAEVSTKVPVDLAMSIAIYDDELQQSVEPGTPRAKERLATVTAVRDAGLDCSVFMMPILPYLTDTTDHLDYALGLVKASGATSVLYTAMHLKPGVKEWFTFWLEREHPELLTKYAQLYQDRTYAPKEYRRWLSARIKPLIAKHGLVRGREDLVTGGVESSALGAGARAPRVVFEYAQTDAATIAPEPTLF